MPVLGTFTNVSTLSLGGNALGCLAHSLTGQPDWAVYQTTGSLTGSVSLFTREATALVYYNSGGSAVSGEAIAQIVHPIIR